MEGAEIIHKFEEIAGKMERDLSLESANGGHRQKKRDILLDDLRAIQEYLDKLPEDMKSGKLKFKVEKTIDMLAKWDTARFISGDLETAIMRLLSEIRKFKIKKEMELIEPESKTVYRKIKRFLKLR
jgi:hypothetical protein